MKKIVIAAVVCLCAIQAASGASRKIEPTVPVALWKPQLGKTLAAARVVDAECGLEEKFAAAIRENATAVGATITSVESEQQLLESTYQLVVTIEDVAEVGPTGPMRRLTPYAIMNFRARLVVEGNEIAQVGKELKTGVLGTCNRLDKLASAGGRFVAEWVARRAPLARDRAG